MDDPQAAAQRLRAYLDARPGAVSLGGSVEYGPEFTAANGRPAGVYALDRDDLEAVLNDLDRADRAIENGNTETDKAYSQLRAANAKHASQAARIRELHQPYRSVYDEGDDRSCAYCNGLTGYAIPWPCDTIQALDGEQP